MGSSRPPSLMTASFYSCAETLQFYCPKHIINYFCKTYIDNRPVCTGHKVILATYAIIIMDLASFNMSAHEYIEWSGFCLIVDIQVVATVPCSVLDLAWKHFLVHLFL
jgi:hypothetical protein